MSRLRLVPLDDAVIFPGMPVTLPVEDAAPTPGCCWSPARARFARVGVVAEVAKRVRLSGRGAAVSLDGLHRGVPARRRPTTRACCASGPRTARRSGAAAGHLTRELEREYRAVVDEILELRGDDGRIRAFVRSITDPGALADTAGYSPDLSVAQKIQLLETLDVVERLTLALRLQQDRLAELQVRKRIREDVEDGAQKQQREYFLRKQMDAIRKELGENDALRRRRITGRKLRMPACRMLSVNRPSASCRGWSGWAIRTPSRR